MIDLKRVISVKRHDTDIIKMLDNRGNIIWEFDDSDFLTLHFTSDGEFSIRNHYNYRLEKTYDLYYNLNNQGYKKCNWAARDLDYNYTPGGMRVHSGDTIKIFGFNKVLNLYYHTDVNRVLPASWVNIESTATYVASGKVTSIIDPSCPNNLSDFQRFFSLFSASKIVDAYDIVLPTSSVEIRAFEAMFKGCDALTTAPKTIDISGFTTTVVCLDMFRGCDSLINPPELPATTLTSSCYHSMFYNCSSLVTAPELPATTLADSCYNSMFWGCVALTSAPELPATTLADSCYSNMFRACESLTTATELPATELAYGCYGSMFESCRSLTAAPTRLPAMTLAPKCYNAMFHTCRSLTVAPELPATTLAEQCYSSMFNFCTSLTEAPDLPATELAELCYERMFENCASLISATIKATNNFSTWEKNPLTYMLSKVYTNGTLYVPASMVNSEYYLGIKPRNWTIGVV